MFSKKSASVKFHRIYVNLTLSTFLRPHSEILKSSQVIILSSQHLTILQITEQKYAAYTAIYLPINFKNLLLGVFFAHNWFRWHPTEYVLSILTFQFPKAVVPSLIFRSAFVLPPLFVRFLGTDLKRTCKGGRLWLYQIIFFQVIL